MTFTSADTMLRRDNCFPMPSIALAPAAFFLGAHMLKCIEEVSLKMGCKEKRKQPLPQKRIDKSTQTIASFAQKKVEGKTSVKVEGKTPVKGATRRLEKKTSGEDSKTRSGRKVVCEAKPSIRSSKSESLKRRCSLEKKKNVKTAVKKTEVVNQKSGMQSSNVKSRPTKGSMTKERRLSTGDCPKRTSESCADMDRTKWLKNPVYASDGESDGRRTDRSDMSPPWLDISVAEEGKRVQSDQKTVTSRSVLDLAKAVAARHVPARIRSTQPKMEVVPEASRTVNLRKDAPPAPMVPSAVSRVLSATEESIRQTIERKLGKPLSEVDTASLKSISEKRMKELTERYARNRPNAKLLDRDIPASIVARLHPRARDSADSICQKVDPQRGRVVV